MNINSKKNVILLALWIVIFLYVIGLGDGILESFILYITLGVFGSIFYLMWIFVLKHIIDNFLEKKDHKSINKIIIMFSLMILFDIIFTNINNPESVLKYSTDKNLSGGILGHMLGNFSMKFFGFSVTFVGLLMIILLSVLYMFDNDWLTKLVDFIKSTKKEKVKFSKSVNNTTKKEIINLDTNCKNNINSKKIKNNIKIKNGKEINEQAKLLEQTLKNFKIDCSVENFIIGNSIIRFELSIPSGVKLSKVSELSNDIALALATDGEVRIDRIPGKSLMGVEIPNPNKSNVLFSEMITEKNFLEYDNGLLAILGKDIIGENIYCDITKMPHVLIGGQTGSGKSCLINSIISSLIMKYTSDELKVWFVDVKMVELTQYRGIPHLIEDIAIKPNEAIKILEKAIVEMESRFEKIAELGTRDITGYNKKSEVQIPKILIVIDELSDLMMSSSKNVEDLICRLAQKGRASGIHMILATQRPSVDVISGLIKANMPSRIGLSVASHFDSKTILDSAGAEKLLGNGDMLYSPVGSSVPIRLQGAFISEKEVEKIVMKVKKQFTSTKKVFEVQLIDQVIEYIKNKDTISNKELKDVFSIGHTKANDILDELCKKGLVGEKNGTNPRKIIKK